MSGHMPWIIVGLVMAASLIIVLFHNRLIALVRRCDQAFADIDVQLNQRHDLVPNLVEAVKGYAGHERATLEAVMRARGAAQVAPTPDARLQAEAGLTAALGRLISVTEAYPDLKANEGFANLQAELSDIESRIAAARRYLNSAVGEYNATLEQFPGVFIAALFGFAPRPFFALDADRRKAMEAAAPAVRF